MKTKFILHGGFQKGKTDEDNRDFYTEILKGVSERATVLLVPFAKDFERRPASISKVRAEFEHVKSTRKLAFEIANEKDFIEQIRLADVVYFHGGISEKLLETLSGYPELEKAVQGKVVAGESAGANVLGRFFYSPYANSVFEGLGVLPIKIIPHYKKEFAGKLDSVGLDFEKVLLPEYEHKVFYTGDEKEF